MTTKNNQKNVGGYFEQEAESVIKALPQRSADIIRKRFGLSGEDKQTLEKIGLDYGVTRERVRQIVADSLKRINKKSLDIYAKPEGRLICTIDLRNGIISKKELLEELRAKNSKEQNAVNFLIECSSRVKHVEVKNFVQPSLTSKGFSLEKIGEIEKIAIEFLEEEGQPVSHDYLVEVVSKKIDAYSTEEIKNWLTVLDKIRANRFGKWGISTWPQIMPKNTKDKIYLVLKETNEPLHFSRISQIIDEKRLSKKKSHPQTVHNELIKDQRFVLIGRGIYALSEWGYMEGTVKEILEKILQEKGPLSKEEILPEIMKVRKVKKATVMINLNNSRFFVKEKDLYKAIS